MAAIVSWEYYSSLHDRISSQAEFAKAEALAEQEVRSVIGPIRWDGITDQTFGYDVLKDCICKVIDTMADNEAIGLGRGVVSVSNDGYTESYATSRAAEVRNDLTSTIRAMLSGTGLVGAY